MTADTANFTLDTSGIVDHWRENRLGVRVGPTYWSDLDSFTQGYVEALFAGLQFFHMECPICEWDCIEGPPGLGALGVCCPLCAEDNGRDVRLHTEARISRDWAGTVEGPDDRKKGFSDLAPETLAPILADCAWVYAKMTRGSPMIAHQGGGYFWRERNGAAGYDGFDPLTAHLGDDGKVYLRVAS